MHRSRELSACLLLSLMACASDASTPYDASRDAPRDDVVTVEIPTASGARQMDTLEVTQARYAEFLGCNTAASCAEHEHAPCEASGFSPETRGGLPVVCVTWAAADDYCRWTGKR